MHVPLTRNAQTLRFNGQYNRLENSYFMQLSMLRPTPHCRDKGGAKLRPRGGAFDLRLR